MNNNFILYWYRSLADTLDTTYINRLGLSVDVVSKSFDNVQYIPVLHKEFTTIEIDIRDDAGRRVPFERGRVTVTLHFRRRKPSFFET